MRTLVESRQFLSALLSAVSGTALFFRMPFPDENNLLHLVWLAKPYLFYGIKWSYIVLLFSTPYIGLPYAWQLPPTDGVLSHECWKLGITAIGCEYLGAGQLSEAGVSDYVTGVLSCLKMWGIYPRGVALPSAGEVVTGEWMLASAEGIFRARCRLGHHVDAGQHLAEIHDEHGVVRHCFTAQFPGRVLGLRSKAYIRSGNWGVLIGRDA